jgi:O-antigen ligase
MKIYRILTFLVLLVAATIPTLAALLCQIVADLFRHEFLTNQTHKSLPGFTQFWIMQKIQLAPAAIFFSLLVLVVGVLLFRRKAEQSAAWFLLLCCISFLATFLLMASVALATALPFVQMVSPLSGQN